MRDGYLRATADEAVGARCAYAAKGIILPLTEVFYHCEEALRTIHALTTLSPIDAVKLAVRITRGTSYSEVLNVARQILLDNDKLPADTLAARAVSHRLIDALDAVHGAIQLTCHQFHTEKYKYAQVVRVIGDDGLIVNIVE